MKILTDNKFLRRIGRPGLLVIAILGLIIIASVIFSGVFSRKQQARSYSPPQDDALAPPPAAALYGDIPAAGMNPKSAVIEAEARTLNTAAMAR